MSDPLLLSIGRAAKMLGVSRPTLRRAVRSGNIKTLQLRRGGRAYITRAELARVLDADETVGTDVEVTS